MSQRAKPKRRALGAAMTSLITISLINLSTHLRYNRSASMPIGWYWIDTSNRAATVGQAVAVCPPMNPVFMEARARGYLGAGSCPEEVSSLLKVVAACPGDRVAFDDAGVQVNGKRWPDSASLTHDAQGRPLPQPHHRTVILGPGEVLLMSSHHPSGFDSRYFGPISTKHIVGRAIKLELPLTPTFGRPFRDDGSEPRFPKDNATTRARRYLAARRAQDPHSLK